MRYTAPFIVLALTLYSFESLAGGKKRNTQQWQASYETGLSFQVASAEAIFPRAVALYQLKDPSSETCRDFLLSKLRMESSKETFRWQFLPLEEEMQEGTLPTQINSLLVIFRAQDAVKAVQLQKRALKIPGSYRVLKDCVYEIKNLGLSFVSNEAQDLDALVADMVEIKWSSNAEEVSASPEIHFQLDSEGQANIAEEVVTISNNAKAQTVIEVRQ